MPTESELLEEIRVQDPEMAEAIENVLDDEDAGWIYDGDEPVGFKFPPHESKLTPAS